LLSKDEPLFIHGCGAFHPSDKNHRRLDKDKAIETTDSRTRLSMVSAIRLRHFSETIDHRYEQMNGVSIVGFLKRRYRILRTL
jgi:hypothetical protein